MCGDILPSITVALQTLQKRILRRWWSTSRWIVPRIVVTKWRYVLVNEKVNPVEGEVCVSQTHPPENHSLDFSGKWPEDTVLHTVSVNRFPSFLWSHRPKRRYQFSCRSAGCITQLAYGLTIPKRVGIKWTNCLFIQVCASKQAFECYLQLLHSNHTSSQHCHQRWQTPEKHWRFLFCGDKQKSASAAGLIDVFVQASENYCNYWKHECLCKPLKTCCWLNVV